MNPPPKDAFPVTREIHRPLCDFSQDSTIKRKAIRMPRDWLKSTIFTQWKSIWEYLQNNEIRQLLGMENEKLGILKLNWMQKQVRYNPRLRKIYPELLKVDDSWCRKSRWSKREMELPREGIYPEPSLSIIGVGGAAQGGHYDIIRIDDLVGKKAMESATVLEGVLQWMDNTEELLLEPDLSTPNASSIEIVGTSWAVGDFFDYILREYPEFKWMSVPCLKDFDIKDQDNLVWLQNPSSEQGESNWPEQFPTEHYTRMRANPMKSQIFWSQHMNNPSKGEGGFNKFDVKWLKYYYIDEIDGDKYVICKDKESDGTQEKFRLRDIPLYGMIDPGGFSEIKSIKRGSRNALLIGGQPKETKKKFIFYAWAGKFKRPSDFIETLFKAHKEWNPIQWRIDPCGQQGYIFGDIKEARTERGEHLPISQMPYETKQGIKDDVIQACMNPMANGFIYVHESMSALIGEIQDYPQGFTKDLVEMMGQILKLYWSRHEVPIRKRETRPRVSYEVSRVTAY